MEKSEYPDSNWTARFYGSCFLPSGKYSVIAPQSEHHQRLKSNIFHHLVGEVRKEPPTFKPLATFLSYNEITEKSEKTSCDFHFL